MLGKKINVREKTTRKPLPGEFYHDEVKEETDGIALVVNVLM